MGAIGEAVRRRAGIALAAATLLVAACATSVPSPEQGATPPASGPRIWDSARGAFISEREFDRLLARAPVVLLGESHDNAEHHALQAEVIGKLVRTGARPALVMEQFDTTFQAALGEAQTRRDADAERLAEAGRLNKRGWQWELYRPLVTLALANGLPVVAGNLSREDARRVMQRGFAALDQPAALGLPPALSEAGARTMTRAIVDGHCGMLSAQSAQPMVAAQQARDAVMADVIVGQAGRGAVLIAGSGHVRRDVGVPVYLARRGVRSLAVGFVEAAPERALEAARAAADQFDLVWLTAPVRRGDPCEAFRKPPPSG